jgi:periplasmic divalent cation tolerance protein
MTFIQVQTTTDSSQAAFQLAETLVKEKLAACAQVIGPIKSTYWWEGKVESAEEWLCLIKTTEARYESLEKRIKKLHSYDNPEIIILPITRGSKEYLDWIEESLS